ncbi:unnamed protein product [Caenorhabditis brenneri]
MGFFSHAAMLGVGYMIGKSYCFRYKVHQLPNDPDASEISFRVERKEGGYPMFWGHPWWHHQYYCHHPHYTQQQGTPAPNQQMNTAPKNPELLEVEKNQ